MAVKIVRQPNKIVVLGSPTSAAALSAGHEGAPAALRSAGLLDRLRSVGYDVEDAGDDPVELSKPDEESPRARNISGVLAAVHALKPRVEIAVKGGALPVILSGDCSIALATIAAVRRYFRGVGLIYMDADADLNIPATTRSGSLDGMVVSHITGRGAAELVRFWSEPPLVRDPDVALFGVARLDPAEQVLLGGSTLRHYLAADVRRLGAAEAARSAVERIHGDKNEFVLHFDVDAISGFAATDYPAEGGLTIDQVREAVQVFVAQPHLAAIDVAAYNPAKDPDGNGAKLVLDLLADALAHRLAALESAAAPAEKKPGAEENREAVEIQGSVLARPAESDSGIAPAVPVPGEAWSSESSGPSENEASKTENADGKPSAGDSGS
ncbi:MAG: arginase family protein [Acidobacteriota bacterium]|nr:arginase family protein [Acidobacteriota bacterium]